MTNNSDSTFLQFDFTSGNGAQQAPLLFSRPSQIITTNDYASVPACLEQIENAINMGNYVAGYFSYEMTYAFSDSLMPPPIKNTMPLLWFGVFKDKAEVDLADKTKESFHISNWQMQVNKQTYGQNFNKVMQMIQENKTNQINYTVPFSASFTGNAYAYYNQLKEAQRSNYCAYLQMDDYTVLSASPELFFHLKGNDITVRPMKGTAKRGKSYSEDVIQKDWLQHSEKNKLENQLITELMMKELEEVSYPDSIHTVDVYRVEKYPTVYQMTTGITGEVLPELSMMDIIKKLFPCGSISGVPKMASLQLIQEIEQLPREIYCGAIGYITPDKEAVFNVPIRTVWLDNKKEKAYYGAGGAITKNSTMEEEYKEVLTKTDILTWKKEPFKLLETMKGSNGHITLFKEHMQRLENSAAFFDIPINIKHIQQQLQHQAALYPDGDRRIRLTVDHSGNSSITVSPLKSISTNKVVLAKQPISSDHLFLYHKTTNRNCYQIHKVVDDTYLDVLLWNEQDEITEFTIGNIVVEKDRQLFTPPIHSGLLAGTFREKLLADNIIKEKVITKKELNECTRIWLINSVRGWIEVTLG